MGKAEPVGNVTGGMEIAGDDATKVEVDDEVLTVFVVSMEDVVECWWTASAGGETAFCCSGNPISVTAAPLVRRGLPPVCVALLNICGNRALLKELVQLPSGGWSC
jgi:hypothetical protein